MLMAALLSIDLPLRSFRSPSLCTQSPVGSLSKLRSSITAIVAFVAVIIGIVAAWQGGCADRSVPRDPAFRTRSAHRLTSLGWAVGLTSSSLPSIDMSSAMKRVALVTGANKGIGYQVSSTVVQRCACCIEFACWSAHSFSAGTLAGILQVVRQLAQSDPNLTVLLGSRDAARGAAAVKELNLTNVQPLTIDVTSAGSIEKAVNEVKTKYGGLDLLCNNAGIFLRGKDTSGEATAVDETFATNYYAVLHSCAVFAPLLRKNARVVNVASQLGVSAMIQMSPEKKKLLHSITDLNALTQQMKSFREAFVSGTTAKQGFAASAYGMSKAATILASKIMAQQAKNGVTYFSACPGQGAQEQGRRCWLCDSSR
jgi:NAD(P)-dependent dehydrogenase (short-subunit alcohol dehydrogenase family)